MLDLSGQRKLPTVLLIDDDLVSREVTATVLTMRGYTVHAAADGAAAFEMLAGAECAPEVILMDAQMPGLSGTRLIAELRARSQARVIAVSGSNPPAEIAAAADGFLLKPFAAEDLEKVLRKSEPQAAAPAPAAANSSEPVISPETLANLRALMPAAAVREIYVAVVADLKRRIEALEAAIAKGDADEVRRLGHAIKGGCGMAGAMEAARLGALLEAIPPQGAAPDTSGNQLDNSAVLLRDLRTAARSLERMLEAELPA
jgi:CheY-like chemotaxis protein